MQISKEALWMTIALLGFYVAQGLYYDKYQERLGNIAGMINRQVELDNRIAKVETTQTHRLVLMNELSDKIELLRNQMEQVEKWKEF